MFLESGGPKSIPPNSLSSAWHLSQTGLIAIFIKLNLLELVLMNLSLTEILLVIGVLAFSISVHESMHSIVAYMLGDRSSHDSGRFSLNPLQHVDPLTTIALPLILLLAGAQPFAAAKPVQVNTYNLKWREAGMALVAASGPLSNLSLALIFSLIFNTISINSEIVAKTLIYAIQINVGLGLFNLIPFPPLDGSRVLYAIAPDFLRDLMNRIESFGFTVIIFFMFVIYPFINPFLISANRRVLELFLT